MRSPRVLGLRSCACGRSGNEEARRCESNHQAKWSAAAQGQGEILVDRDGDKIGKLYDVYVDMETAPPGQLAAALGVGG
jgi:hypothetical protein